MSEFHGTYEPPPARSAAPSEADIRAASEQVEAWRDGLPEPFGNVPLPTVWHSIPGAVRFAVWLWAISTIIGVVVGVVALVAFVAGWLS